MTDETTDVAELHLRLSAARTQLADAEKRIEALAAIPEIDRRVRARHETNRLRDSSVHACDCSAGLARCRVREAAIRQLCEEVHGHGSDYMAGEILRLRDILSRVLAVLGDETGTDKAEQPEKGDVQPPSFYCTVDGRHASHLVDASGIRVFCVGSVGAQDQGSTE